MKTKLIVKLNSLEHEELTEMCVVFDKYVYGTKEANKSSNVDLHRDIVRIRSQLHDLQIDFTYDDAVQCLRDLYLIMTTHESSQCRDLQADINRVASYLTNLIIRCDENWDTRAAQETSKFYLQQIQDVTWN